MCIPVVFQVSMVLILLQNVIICEINGATDVVVWSCLFGER